MAVPEALRVPQVLWPGWCEVASVECRVWCVAALVLVVVMAVLCLQVRGQLLPFLSLLNECKHTAEDL
ncbi:hypothetical protein E2C01_022537 [Portunus trituberculatus]|uniref:Uncharacterized protein n=1 Tax=Portunus trituberculatus TaxID=210409 RepID=A0A5B7E5L9_PORTR|nr:hypothetical protein [Portunus trituberculatus]